MNRQDGETQTTTLGAWPATGTTWHPLRSLPGVKKTYRALDLFCGAGGSSWGAQAAGFEIACGVDLNEAAIAAYKKNFPNAHTECKRVEELDLAELARKIGRIDLILASPECTNHSPAKGNVPRCEKSRRTALQIHRFAKVFKPRWIVLENVVNMRRWHRYDELIEGLEELEYHVKPVVLNAADFGVPQSRRRLFVLCDNAEPPPVPKPNGKKPATARSVIDMGEHKWNPLHKPKRAVDTLARADRAIATVGEQSPFLIVYYGSDGSGGWQKLSRPLRTITTLDRFAIVKPSNHGHQMRMLQVPELKRAMGLPSSFVAGLGSRRDQIRAIGNGVCPPVMRAVLAAMS